MFGWLFGKREVDRNALEDACRTLAADMHSHLLPGIDDGVKTPGEGASLIESMFSTGFSRVITTPHIMPDMYRNTPESIRSAYRAYASEPWFGHLQPAAEYYLDDSIRKVLATAPEDLMTFRGREETYLLVELGFGSVPYGLHELVFDLTTAGIRPVIAHPERYLQLAADQPGYFDTLVRNGCLLQVNIGSFHPKSHPGHRALALSLAASGNIHFLGTDMHHEGHWLKCQASLAWLIQQQPGLLRSVRNSTLVSHEGI